MKIGYTTGVFDLFHIGHLKIIKQAREQCDYLIVGVSTDALVYEYKNKYPLMNFDERFQIIDSLKYVDRVVAQESLDKYAAWKKLHYNILFHGDDWKGSELYNDMQQKLEKEGVEIVFFPYTEGISSTRIKQFLYSVYH